MSVTSRQRSVPPTMFTDETLMELPDAVRLTGLGLRFYVDDEGRGSANPSMIRGQLWPLAPEITNEVVDGHLVALEDAGYIELYAAQGRTYLVVADWPSVDRGKPSRCPSPPSRASRESLAVEEERGRKEEGVGGGGRPGGGEVRAGGAPAAPTDEPSPFCPKHQPYGTDTPCGPCGGARKRHELWLRDQTDAATTDLDGSTD